MKSLIPALRAAKRPVALTGAGISAPSGVPTFQTLWKGRPVRDFLGRDYFCRDPVGFFELYCDMVAWCDAEPNLAHKALARFHVPIITQNIDGLHQKAGSRDVLELHGNLRRVLCPRCGAAGGAKPFCATLRPLYEAGDLAGVKRALHCACGASMDIDVVLYGDTVRELETAQTWLETCDLLLVIGTSLTTYPAAAMPDMARRHGACVLIEDEDCIAAFEEE